MTDSLIAAPGRRQRPSRPRRRKPGSVENTLGAALVLALSVTSFSADAFNGAAPQYRNYGLIIAGALATAAILTGFGRTKATDGQSRVTNRDAMVALASGYLGWTGIQNFFLQGDLPGATQSLIALLVVLGAITSNTTDMLLSLRRWLTVALALFLLPALTGSGYVAESRVWFDFLPGRYFSYSNPNALAFLAGIGVLVAVPVIANKRAPVLASMGILLAVLTAGYTTAIALAIGLLAYMALGRIQRTGPLRLGVNTLAAATPVILLWLPTNNALRFFSDLAARWDFSGRTLLDSATMRHSTIARPGADQVHPGDVAAPRT